MPFIDPSEVETAGATGQEIDPSQVDFTDPSQAPRTSTFLGNASKELAGAWSGLAGIASDINPFSPMGLSPKVTSLPRRAYDWATGQDFEYTPEEKLKILLSPSTQLEEARQKYIGNPDYTGVGGVEKAFTKGIAGAAALPGVGGWMGAVSGFGSGAGGSIGEEVGHPIVGSLLGGITPVAAWKLLKGGGRALINALSPNLESQADDVAKQTIKQFTNPDYIVSGLDEGNVTPFSGFMRTAELAQDPGLATLTKSIEKSNPIATSIGESMDSNREALRQSILSEAQGVAPKSTEEVGALIRGGLQEGKGLLKDQVDEAYNIARGGQGTIPTEHIGGLIDDTVKEFVSQKRKIDPDIMDFVNEQTNRLRNGVSPAELIDIRETVGNEIGNYRKSINLTPAQERGKVVLAKLFGAVNNAEESAGQVGQWVAPRQLLQDEGKLMGLTAEDAAKIKAARGLAGFKGLTYGDANIGETGGGVVGDIIEGGDFGRVKMPASDILGKSLNGIEEARAVTKALRVNSYLGGAKGAEAEAQRAAGLMEELRLRSSTSKIVNNQVQEVLRPQAFANNWKKLREVSEEVLNKDQIRAMDTVSEDLVRRGSFEDLASKVSAGQSVTPHHNTTIALVKNSIAEGVKSKIPFIGKIFSSVAERREKELSRLVDERIMKVAFDKEFARDFLGTPTPAKIERISKAVMTDVLKTAGAISQKGLPALAVTAREAQKQQASNSKEPTPTPKDFSSKVDSAIENASTVVNNKAEEDVNQRDLSTLTEAIIKQESGGKANATSPVGAKGLMQLMDNTGKELFQKSGLKGEYDPYNPEQNKLLGTMYIKQLVNKYGDVRMALAAYNYGMGNIAKLQKKHGTSFDDIASHLPAETAKYVPMVLKNFTKLQQAAV